MRTTVSCQRITFGFMVWALTGMLTSAAEPDNAPAIAPPAAGWKYLGQLKTRSAKEITASNWSVGAETMDRDFTIYDTQDRDSVVKMLMDEHGLDGREGERRAGRSPSR